MKRRGIFALLLLNASAACASDFGAGFAGAVMAIFGTLASGAYLALLLAMAMFKVFTTPGAVKLARTFSLILGAIAILALLLCLTDPARIGKTEWSWVLGNLGLVLTSLGVPQWQLKRSAI